MIFTRKTRHKSTKHSEITSCSRGVSRTTTCGNTIETPLRLTMIALKIFFYMPSTILRPNGANVLSFNSVLVGLEGSVLSINLISQSSSSP